MSVEQHHRGHRWHPAPVPVAIPGPDDAKAETALKGREGRRLRLVQVNKLGMIEYPECEYLAVCCLQHEMKSRPGKGGGELHRFLALDDPTARDAALAAQGLRVRDR